MAKDAPHHEDDDLMRSNLEETLELPRAGSAQDPDAQLDPKEELFVDAMIRHGNRTQAAREAGYGSPSQVAARLLRRPNVGKAIRIRLEGIQTAQRSKLSKDALVKRLETLLELGLQGKGEKFERVKIIELLCKLQGYITPKAVFERQGGSRYAALADTLRRYGEEFTAEEREHLRREMEVDIAQASECMALLGGPTLH